MLIIKDEAVNDETMAQQVAEIISAVDLEKIKTAFGKGDNKNVCKNDD